MSIYSMSMVGPDLMLNGYIGPSGSHLGLGIGWAGWKFVAVEYILNAVHISFIIVLQVYLF